MFLQRYKVSMVILLIVFIIGSCARPRVEIDPLTLSRDKLLQVARGSTIRFAMWGGDERINRWVDTFVVSRMKERYGVTVERIPMDAAVFITKLSNEKKAGKTDGSLDLLWINGENFARAKREGLLYGPYADKLENWKYVDPRMVSLDFGLPVEGYEAPYGKAQFVFEYDSAKIPDPPKTFRELGEWVKKNPGRFTYPQPPDFTGSAFIRQAFYEIGGGYEPFLTAGNRIEFEKRAAFLYAWLNEIKPYLWQKGRSYPASKAILDGMFERGEVDINMSYTQSGAQGLIQLGRYPKTVRTFVMKNNSLSNYHFTAIPFNARNKAGAFLLSDFLLSPEAQLSKNDPAHWGDFTVLDLGRLAEKDRRAFLALDLGEATLDLQTLEANAVPEILPEYLLLLDKGWETYVLRAKWNLMKGLVVLTVFVFLMTLGGIIPPILDVFGGWEGTRFSLTGSVRVWKALFATPGFMESLLFTFHVAVLSALASSVAGIFLAWGVYSLPLDLRTIAGLYRIPIILPHLTAAFLTLLFWGPTGIATRVLYGLGLIHGTGDFTFILYGGWGGGIILAYWFKETPFVMLLCLSSLSQMDRRLLLTAANLGARRWQTFRALIWPNIRSSVHTAFLILFLYSAGAFEIPFLLGESRPSMVSIRLYTLLFDKNIGERPTAMAFLLLFFLFCLLFLGFYLRVTGKPHFRGRKL